MKVRVGRTLAARGDNSSSPNASALRKGAVAMVVLLVVAALCCLAASLPAHAASAPDPVAFNAETATAPDGILVGLQYHMVVAKEQLRSMISAFPDLPRIVPFVVGRITKDYGPDFIWTIVLRTIAIFAGAGLGGAIAKRLFRPVDLLLPMFGERSDFGKLGALLLHGLIRTIELSVFGLIAIILFLTFYKGHEAARYAFWTLFSVVMVVRAAAIGFRLVLAPDLPGLRLPALNNATARRLYRDFLLITAMKIGSAMAAVFLYNIGLPSGENTGLPYGLILAASIGLTALATMAIVIVIWRDRVLIGQLIGIRLPADGETRHDLRSVFAMHWHIFAIWFVLAIWIFGVGGRLLTNDVQGDVFATYAALISLLLVDGLARITVRYFFEVRGDEASPNSIAGVTDPGAYAEDNSFGSIILHNGRIALAVIATILVAQIWHINASAIAPEGLVSDVAQAVFQIIVTLLFASSAWGIIKIAINRLTPLETIDALALSEDSHAAAGLSRRETLLPLLRKFLFVTIVAMMVMSVVSSLGINIGPLLAGAGVVGIAIGFGAQTLVRDILSGIFFLIDDAFRIGEYVDVGEGKGTVEHMSIRALMLRHQRGPVYTVPFGAVRRVVNYSRDWAISKLEIRVPFDTDIDKVRRLVKKVGEELAREVEFGPYLLQPPKSQGINRIDDSAFVLRVKFMTKPNDQFLVRREVYRRLQEAFHHNGIEFASRRVVVEAAELNADEEAAAAANVAVLTPAGAAARNLG